MSNEKKLATQIREGLQEHVEACLKHQTWPELVVELAGESDPGNDDSLRNSLEILRSMTADEFDGLTVGIVRTIESAATFDDMPDGIKHYVAQHFDVFLEAVYAMLIHCRVTFKDSAKRINLIKESVEGGAKLLSAYREGKDDIRSLAQSTVQEKMKRMLSDTSGVIPAYLAGAFQVADEAVKKRSKT